MVKLIFRIQQLQLGLLIERDLIISNEKAEIQNNNSWKYATINIEKYTNQIH